METNLNTIEGTSKAVREGLHTAGRLITNHLSRRGTELTQFHVSSVPRRTE